MLRKKGLISMLKNKHFLLYENGVIIKEAINYNNKSFFYI